MILFDEVNDYYSIADTADLTFPNGDWCVGFWARVDDNTGSTFQYALSTGAVAGGNFNIFIGEAGSGGPAVDRWSIALGGTITNGTIVTSADGVNRLIVVQRSGTTVNLYSCTNGGSVQNHLSASLSAALDGGAWNIGRRGDADANRYYGSHMGELFLIHDSTLSQEQIKAMADGLPVWALGKTLKLYLPMTSAEATLKDLAGTYNATRVDAPTTSEHTRIGVARADRVLVVAAGGGTITVSSDLADSYLLRADVSGDIGDSYAVRSNVSGGLADSYLLRNYTDSDLADAYILRASVSGDLGDSYAIDSASSVASDFGDSYALRALVSGDFADSYAVQSNVSGDLVDSYHLLASVSNDLADSYLLRAGVTTDLADGYALRNFVAGDYGDEYLLRAFVTGDLDDSYAFMGEVTLTQEDLDAVAAAVWAAPEAVTAHARLDAILARLQC